jgi:aryl-alcohol dehydrogenase-like predicted oxidoreductase
MAEALAQWGGNRDAVIVATKGGLTRPRGRWDRDARPDHLRAACDQSLTALGVECIDLYQLHAPDPNVPLPDSIGALAELQQAGKIKWIGVSNVSVAEIEQASAIVDVVTVQNRLNPFFREAIETGVVQHCADHDIGFLAYSPVGGGRLNKKLPSYPTLRPIADHHGLSAHAVVIAWVLAQGPTVIPIPAGRTEHHALDSLTAADVTLTDDELDAIDRTEFSRA